MPLVSTATKTLRIVAPHVLFLSKLLKQEAGFFASYSPIFIGMGGSSTTSKPADEVAKFSIVSGKIEPHPDSGPSLISIFGPFFCHSCHQRLKFVVAACRNFGKIPVNQTYFLGFLIDRLITFDVDSAGELFPFSSLSEII